MSNQHLKLYRQEGKFGLYQILVPGQAAVDRIFEYLTFGYGVMWIYYFNGRTTLLHSLDHLGQMTDAFFKKSREGFPQEWQKQWQEISMSLKNTSKTISKADLSLLDDHELEKLYKEVYELLSQMWGISVFIDGLDPGFDIERMLAIKKELDITEADYNTLITPAEPSYVLTLEQMLFEAKGNKKVLLQLVEEYFWHGTDYSSFEEVDEQYFMKLSAKAEAQDISDIKQKQVEALERNNLEDNPFAVFQTLSQWRDERKKLNYIGLYGCIRLLREGLQRKQMDDSLVNLLLPEEACKVFLGTIDKIKLEERENGFMFHILENREGFEYLQGSKANEMFESLKQYLPHSNVDSFEGVVACKGRIKGGVRVVPHPSSTSGQSFEVGDILVTSMTRPEFVPLMKKAGAIITDEGGISSHAAIVSRELNKPCIIGTKIATQVLKDGDEVEVDAEKGVVRIIKKADG